ncbi:MAG: hypothetical protein KF799_15615 [Bdellovibrionales bacterium]|nr:hypothetical protein [Bdellovibrionales bacterium]
MNPLVGYMLLMLLITYNAFGFDRGDLRDGYRSTLRERMKDRDAYHVSVRQRLDNVNQRREELVAFVSAGARLRALSNDLKAKCASKIYTLNESEKCLVSLEELIRDSLDLEIRLARFSDSNSIVIRDQAAPALADMRALRVYLYRVLEVWNRNKGQLLLAAVDRRVLTAREAGRVQAVCKAARFDARRDTLALQRDLILARQSKDGFILYRADKESISTLGRIAESESLCQINLDEERKQYSAARSAVSSMLGSQDAKAWFEEGCAKAQGFYGQDLNCGKGITPELLFTIHSMKKQGVR